MQGVFPPDFTNSILAWMDSWHVHDQKLHNLKFNELTIAFAALGNVVFPFSVPGSRMMQIPTLSSGFETPTFAYLLNWVRPMFLPLIKFLNWGVKCCFLKRQRLLQESLCHLMVSASDFLFPLYSGSGMRRPLSTSTI